MTTVNHGTYYAMKRVSKKHIVAKRQEEHMLFEKKILKAIQCDFIVRCLVIARVMKPNVACLRDSDADGVQRTWLCPLCSAGCMLRSRTRDTSTWWWSTAAAGSSGPNSKKCETTQANKKDVWCFESDSWGEQGKKEIWISWSFPLHFDLLGKNLLTYRATRSLSQKALFVTSQRAVFCALFLNRHALNTQQICEGQTVVLQTGH